MSGPVPGFGGPLLRLSSGFFGQDLREFVVVIVGVVIVNVVVVFLHRRWGSAEVAAAVFFWRHQGMAVVLAGA